jgi:putative transposase
MTSRLQSVPTPRLRHSVTSTARCEVRGTRWDPRTNLLAATSPPPRRRPAEGAWPTPRVDAIEPVAAKYAADWPAWGTARSPRCWVPTATRCSPPPFSGPSAGADCCWRPGSGQTADRGRGCGSGYSETHHASGTGVWQMDFSELEAARGGIWRICAVIDYLDNLGADRGVMDVVDADDDVIGEASAPIAVVTDNGHAFVA